MKKRTWLCLLLAALLAAGCLSGCGGTEEEGGDRAAEVTSESLYVKKVENLGEDFILGMDASSVLSLERGGAMYHDFAGQEADVFQVLAANGVN